MDNPSELTYQTAFEELQKLVQAMEQGSISVDQLSEKVQRASVLIQICRSKLYDTEAEVRDILERMGREPRPEDN